MNAQTHSIPGDVKIKGRMTDEFKEILTPGALEFVAKSARNFTDRRDTLLHNRGQRQKKLDAGEKLDFLKETEEIRNSSWSIDPLPHDLRDRRVEITGPASDRKMVINALNSGAKVFMADFEDANTPTWENCIRGQINMRDAINRNIDFADPRGKRYELKEKTAVLVIRPGGSIWMRSMSPWTDGRFREASLILDSTSITTQKHCLKKTIAVLSDIFRNWKAIWKPVCGMNSLSLPRKELKIAQGTIKATVLIETITAAFEMDEILYELREHSAGLNCGCWDYIFSFIKRFSRHPEVILPDRSRVTMTVPFMRAYTLLAVKTCHKRKAPCIGGMAAQIPVKNDPEKNEVALSKVRADKEREALDGHDGSWVAHPALVPVAMEVFDRHMLQQNQIDKSVRMWK